MRNSVGTSAVSGRGVATVALDASVLINFLILNRVEVLANLTGFRFVVLDAVEHEVRRPHQQITLDAAFEQGLVDRAGASNPRELEIFAEHRRVMGLGEAACLAAAEVRGWMLASDERRLFRRLARERIGDQADSDDTGDTRAGGEDRGDYGRGTERCQGGVGAESVSGAAGGVWRAGLGVKVA